MIISKIYGPRIVESSISSHSSSSSAFIQRKRTNQTKNAQNYSKRLKTRARMDRIHGRVVTRPKPPGFSNVCNTAE
ncbi:hypothetical protein OROMI_017197 [Orobanche minor]